MMQTFRTAQDSNFQRWTVRLTMAAGLVVFGWASLYAGLAVLLSPLMFDASDSISNPLTWNCALAPLAVIAAYVGGLGDAIVAVRTGEPRAYWRWLLIQGLGVVWVALAWGLIGFVCAGSFTCR